MSDVCRNANVPLVQGHDLQAEELRQLKQSLHNALEARAWINKQFHSDDPELRKAGDECRVTVNLSFEAFLSRDVEIACSRMTATKGAVQDQQNELPFVGYSCLRWRYADCRTSEGCQSS